MWTCTVCVRARACAAAAAAWFPKQMMDITPDKCDGLNNIGLRMVYILFLFPVPVLL